MNALQRALRAGRHDWALQIGSIFSVAIAFVCLASALLVVANIQELLAYRDGVFLRWMANSLVYTAGAALLGTLLAAMCGYALAKFRFRGRTLLMTFMLASVTIPGVVLLAPNVELIWRFGWMDQYRALLIPSAVSVFGMFLFRQAMLGVPDEIIEAGRLDGCG